MNSVGKNDWKRIEDTQNSQPPQHPPAGNDRYTFDAANRMTQVAGKESYRYDGHGRRVKVTTASGQTDYPVY
ncbi:MAG: RHS repeat protein, partial [Proteobacteria bacterium]|nr:RHS repeat protein [Pseudomonadota bacterium]